MASFLRTTRLATLLAAGLSAIFLLSGWQPAHAKDKVTIGFVNFDGAAITANSFATAIVVAAPKIGWEVINQDPKGDLGRANAICTQFVTRKVDVIVVNVYEATQMAQCSAYAGNASIPVFFLGNSLTKGMAGAISVTVPRPINDAFFAYAAGVKDLKVLALTYNPGAPCRLREKDFDAGLAKSGSTMQVQKQEITVPGQVTSALAATQAWLNGHPANRKENLAIWACFADPGFGALSALKQAGRSGIPIYAWDMTGQIVDALRAGEMTATLWLDSDGIAQQLISQIKDHADGKPPREDEAASVVVTGANLDGFLAAHPIPR